MSNITSENPPPVHCQQDWDFFQRHLENNIQIPLAFDKVQWKIGTEYEMRVGNIYDPSHFWVVHHDNELNLFHKYLYDFYSKYGTHYRIPVKNFKTNMYCVVYTEKAFYRGIFISIPHTMHELAFVFLIDFGYTSNVEIEHVYFLTKPMYTVPQFAIRACMATLGPKDSALWAQEAVNKMRDLVSVKVLLCQVENIDCETKILYIDLRLTDTITSCFESLTDVLIRENLAKRIGYFDVKEMKLMARKNQSAKSKKGKLQFLLPMFDELEKLTHVSDYSVATFLAEFSVSD